MSELKQISFPPDVLARISPEVSLQRHLSIGLRPNLRNFNEFKSVNISQGNLNDRENVVGSSVLKSGNVTIITTITLGIVEDGHSDALLSNGKKEEYDSIYPVVEIARGRSGAPTDEEMILSQKLYENILHSKVIPSSSLRMEPGISIMNEDKINVYYPDKDQETFDLLNINRSKKYSFVLYANLKVFSRSGPLFDLCYLALTNAIKSIILPRVFLNHNDSVKIPLNSRRRYGNSNRSQINFTIDNNEKLRYKLNINESALGISSNFGILKLEESLNDENEMELDEKSILLTDIEGECEESSIISKMSIVSTNETIKSISLSGGGSPISLDNLKKAIEISILRSKNFNKTNTVVSR